MQTVQWHTGNFTSLAVDTISVLTLWPWSLTFYVHGFSTHNRDNISMRFQDCMAICSTVMAHFVPELCDNWLPNLHCNHCHCWQICTAIYNDVITFVWKWLQDGVKRIPGANLGGVLITKFVSMKGHQLMFQAVFSLILQNRIKFLIA